MIADFCSLVKANRGRDRTKKKDKHAGKAGKSDQLNRAKGSRGDFVPFSPPLAGCRDSVPAGAWGNAPTVGRLTYSKGKVKHGTLVAGSEASLRTNSRSRRSGIPQQHKKSTMKMCIRSNPEGDRRLRLFSLPSAVAPIWRDNVQVVGRAAWGRSCGSAKLLAGTLRCLRLC